jgi:SAM-dependent methyltransferase
MLDQNFWEKRYQDKETGWNIGTISTPLRNYFDSIENKNCSILIPGCGYGHEAKYLFENGFQNVTILDISPSAIKDFKKRIPDFPKEKLFTSNFFEHNKTYDLIIEQTFFCAIDTKLRQDYVDHSHRILNKNGKIAGLLFNKHFGNDHPPFGGSKEEYQKLFEKKFNINSLKIANDSIEPRKGLELFFEFQKLEKRILAK